jgi:hypothetical protein
MTTACFYIIIFRSLNINDETKVTAVRKTAVNARTEEKEKNYAIEKYIYDYR